jgi:hypothetical protein
MKLDETITLVFKNPKGDKKKINVTIRELLNSSNDDLHDLLESLYPCQSSSCNNESNNFCDCEPIFDDYKIEEVLF